MQIAISYFGRPSEFLLMTSEHLDIPEGTSTLKQVLNKLRTRGDRWAYELDDNHVVCTVDRKTASLSDTLKNGNEIGIFSRKSLFEV
jgi:molybdopterin converting factor small subunit